MEKILKIMCVTYIHGNVKSITTKEFYHYINKDVCKISKYFLKCIFTM